MYKRQALLGLVDIAISMKRTPAGDPQRLLEAITRYSETPRSLTIELSGEDYKVLGTPEEVSSTGKAEKFLAALTDVDQMPEDLMRVTSLSKQDISRAVQKLGCKCIRSGKGHKGDPYRYRRNLIDPTSKSIPETLDALNKSPEPLKAEQ